MGMFVLTAGYKYGCAGIPSLSIFKAMAYAACLFCCACTSFDPVRLRDFML